MTLLSSPSLSPFVHSSEHPVSEQGQYWMMIRIYHAWTLTLIFYQSYNSVLVKDLCVFKGIFSIILINNLCVGTWNRGCRQTEWLDGRKSSWHRPPAPHHRVHGVSSAGWSPPVSAADVCPRRTACVPAGGPLQGACWGPPVCSGWWCPFLWCLDVRWWP